VAVAFTVFHNFAWHECFTFRDHVRGAREFRCLANRFLKFNLITGVISVTGNLLVVQFLTARTRIPLAALNLLAIAICGVANYFANERLVFRVLVARPSEQAAYLAFLEGGSEYSDKLLRQHVSDWLKINSASCAGAIHLGLADDLNRRIVRERERVRPGL
jgi:hypothetical protein